MKPIQIKCELIGLERRKDTDTGTVFILKELTNNTRHKIIVDESLGHVKHRLKEQYYGDLRSGIYLTRNMTNIDVNTKGDIWDINQEDWNWYTFSKEDILKNIIDKDKVQDKVSIPIDYEKIKEIAEGLKPEIDKLYSDNEK